MQAKVEGGLKGWKVLGVRRHFSIKEYANVCLKCVRASICVQIRFANIVMEAYSPCTPPPKTPGSEPPSPKEIPESKAMDDKRWIRAHARDMVINYRKWLADQKAKENQSERVRYLTSTELASQEMYPSATAETPVFHNELCCAETMILHENILISCLGDRRKCRNSNAGFGF